MSSSCYLTRAHIIRGYLESYPRFFRKVRSYPPQAVYLRRAGERVGGSLRSARKAYFAYSHTRPRSYATLEEFHSEPPDRRARRARQWAVYGCVC